MGDWGHFHASAVALSGDGRRGIPVPGATLLGLRYHVPGPREQGHVVGLQGSACFLFGSLGAPPRPA